MIRRIALAALLLGAPALVACGESEPTRPGIAAQPEATPPDVEFIVPYGTGEKIDAGEPVELMPDDLTMQVGETIRITNLDNRGHVVGVFYVGANEVLVQKFTSPGVLSGECSLNDSGTFTLTVEAA
ncbi:MAG: hypothetical protein MUE78_01300 [Ilumatobacteraceae bacterium]|jgi:plastocyanin|nr:hypothetical protein [Ilumatobacteraceae bacterium]